MQPKSREGAQRQYDAIYNQYARDWSCPGDMFGGFDWPTMRLNDPDTYYTLRGLLHLIATLPSRHSKEDQTMAYPETKLAQARALMGKRIEIPPHLDMWARGARFGTVVSIGRDGRHVNVRLDHSGAKRLFKVWRIDFDHIRVL